MKCGYYEKLGYYWRASLIGSFTVFELITRTSNYFSLVKGDLKQSEICSAHVCTWWLFTNNVDHQPFVMEPALYTCHGILFKCERA